MSITWTLAAAGLLAGQTGNYGTPAPYSQTTAGPTVVAQAPSSGIGRFLPWRRSSAPAEPQFEEDRNIFQRFGDRVGKVFGRGDEPTPRQTTGPDTGRGTMIIDEPKGTYRTIPGGTTTAEPPLGAPTKSPSYVPAQKLPAGPGGTSAPIQVPAPGPFKLSSHTVPADDSLPRFKSATIASSSPASVPGARVPVSAAELSARPNRISASLADKVGRDEKFAWITGQLRQEGGRWVLWYATPEVLDPHDGRLPLLTEFDLSKFHDGDLVSVHGSVVMQGRTAAYRTPRVDLIQSQGR